MYSYVPVLVSFLTLRLHRLTTDSAVAGVLNIDTRTRSITTEQHARGNKRVQTAHCSRRYNER